jgi:hypothetical protein
MVHLRKKSLSTLTRSGKRRTTLLTLAAPRSINQSDQFFLLVSDGRQRVRTARGLEKSCHSGKLQEMLLILNRFSKIVTKMTFSSPQAKADATAPCSDQAWVPTPQTEDQVAAGLREALRKVIEEENTSQNVEHTAAGSRSAL